MKIASIITTSITIISLVGLMTGCAWVEPNPIPLTPGAEMVVVSKNPAPQACKFLDKVSSQDVNGATIPYTSDKNLDERELNTLKNQALQLGANYIGSFEEKEDKGRKILKAQSMTGLAYQCPADVLAKIIPYKDVDGD
jgi:hypothetical protein